MPEDEPSRSLHSRRASALFSHSAWSWKMSRGSSPGRHAGRTRLIAAAGACRRRGLAFLVMPANRMNREEFFAKLAPLGEDALRKALWNLYWRGSAAVRERIEDELQPAQQPRRKPATAQPADPGVTLLEVREFAELARGGAYIAGDRRVSPKERTRWRLTFRQLATDAEAALKAKDPSDAEAALTLIIDLACEMKDAQYFRSEDPVEAARFVVSDAVALLWESVRDRHGFDAFVSRAAPQLVRWESRYGWTRGWGQVAGKETSLAAALANMLAAPDAWTTFAACYLDALDQVARTEASTAEAPRFVGSLGYGDNGFARRERTGDLAEWHEMLLERLAGSDAEDQLDRLVSHPALGGPERTFLQAQLAHDRGDTAAARKLIQECVRELPGHPEFAQFAAEMGA
jgi:hypothetical protein